MPDLDIITVGFCPQYWSTWKVKGSRDAEYVVTLSGGEGPAHCTCPAFKYSGEFGQQDCKHVRKVWEHGCLWNPQWHSDPGPNDYQDHGIEMLSCGYGRGYGAPCPGCGGELQATKIAV